MSTYKLYHFGHSPRADLARLIFHYAGVDFEDNRLTKTEWPQYKSKIPYGQVPGLEVDGKMLAQSCTIFRFLARRHGLAGKDEWEQSLAEMYGDCISDLRIELVRIYLEQDPEKKKENFAKYIADKIVPHIATTEKFLEENGTGFLVGSELTWADLAYFEHFTLLDPEPLLDDAPNFKGLLERVGSIPSVQKWLQIRVKPKIPKD